MNQRLLISLLCGDQCHCWKLGHGKLGKNGVANLHVANGVRGAKVINWIVANPYHHGNWTR